MPGLLSDAALLHCKAIAERSAYQDATIQRDTTSADPYGFLTDSWSTVGTIKCRIAAPTPAEMVQLAIEKIGQVVPQLMTFADTTDIQKNDRVVTDSHTYVVHQLLTPQTYSTMNQALVAEIR